jgi:hypothetical protein
LALPFEKLESQVRAMGAALANRSLTVAEQTRLAIEHLRYLNDLDAIWAQIMLARQHDAGFRGAGPLNEPINAAIPLPDCPSRGTVFA